MSYYTSPDTNNFNKIYSKKEFQLLKSKPNYMYQEPFQNLLRNYISHVTPYNSILLFNGLGTGKTCSAISIAEGFKNDIKNMGKRIIVLVKNKNIEKNFTNELMSGCSNGNDDLKLIKKTYDIMTYGTFISRILGAKKMGPINILGIKNKDYNREERFDSITNVNNTVIIIDEVHNIVGNSMYNTMFNILKKSVNYKLILLSATPIYDNPREIFEISNLLNANITSKILPIRNDLFKEKFIYSLKPDDLKLKGSLVYLTDIGKNSLINSLKGKVSYLAINIDTTPEKIDMGIDLQQNKKGTLKIIKCEMSNYQLKVYKEVIKKDLQSSLNESDDIVLGDFANSKENNINDTEEINFVDDNEFNNINNEIENALKEIYSDKKQIKSGLYKNSSDASTIVYPNKMYGKEGFLELSKDESCLSKDKLKEYSNKLYQLLLNIEKSTGPVFIYSNYVNFGGTNLIKKLLLVNGYKKYNQNINSNKKSFILFNENISVQRRDLLRQKFNDPLNKNGDIIKIIIGSPIMSEGITLKNVRQVHILEPTWNLSRINQIIGRAIRNHSHDDLPNIDQNVEVYKYVSVGSDSTIIYIDKEKYILSEEKDRTNKQVERILKEISFDCSINKLRNDIYHDKFKDHSPECDYKECKYTCLFKGSDQQIDKSTYNLNIEYFEKFKISKIQQYIIYLFKQHFIWKLEDIFEKINKYLDQDNNQDNNNLIYQILNNFTKDKIKLLDKYDRSGFLIINNDYFIFNPDDKKEESSIYDKFFNFTQNTNNITLSQFLNLNTEDIIIPKTRDVKKIIYEDIPYNPEYNLSNSDIRYNNNIKNTKAFYGTFRTEPTNNNTYGIITKEFKLIDNRNNTLKDKRKLKSGKNITFYDITELNKILNYLIDEYILDIEIKKRSKNELQTIIIEILTDNNAVFK